VFDPTGPGRICTYSFNAVDHSVDGGKTSTSKQAGLGRTNGSLFVIVRGGNTIYVGDTGEECG
jgi:hypothetical protein